MKNCNLNANFQLCLMTGTMKNHFFLIVTDFFFYLKCRKSEMPYLILCSAKKSMK